MKQNYYTGIFKNEKYIKADEFTPYKEQGLTAFLEVYNHEWFNGIGFCLNLVSENLLCRKSDFKQLTNHVWNGRKYKKIDETKRPFKLKYKLEIDTYQADKAIYGLKTMLSEMSAPPYIKLGDVK